MFPEDFCETCPYPRLGKPGPCQAQLGKSKIVCAYMNADGPDFRPAFYNNLTGESVGVSQPIKQPKSDQQKKKYTTVKEMVSMSQSMQVLKEINNCKYKSKKIQQLDENGIVQVIHVITNDDGSESIYSDCGCGMNICGLGKGRRGDNMVAFDDCKACIIERGLIDPNKEFPRNPGFGDQPQEASLGLPTDQ